ncbi:hypothetical protein EOPP23_13560 [Endozoicomonas sp. OPT23]|uniref:M48 family metalloprotease n=1 Tax=Endozoicomonas sp. OPT23 TaxID=2072845 RepID=UPI00129A8CD4|nr:M48 family metalloprotease [Endozoicomonas sp. OPT23]MRI34018.1 hypothetical protein [Endozoicomonas sp. OPT23]
MKKKLAIAITGALLLSGCKTMQTISEGVTKAVDMRPEYEKFEGQFIASDQAQSSKVELQAQKEENQASTDNAAISFLTADKKDDSQKVWQLSEEELLQQTQKSMRVEVPAFERYMDGITKKLLAHWPNEKPDYTFKTQLNSQQLYGASTKGDGVLNINLGVIESAGSEDELAFILAHEMAHNLLHHSLREETLNAQSLWLEAGFNVASSLALAQSMEMTDSGNKKTLSLTNKDLLKKSIAKNTVNQQLIQDFSSDVLGSSWSRTLEEEADLLALDLIVKAGYSRNAAQQSMQRIAASQDKADNFVTELAKKQAQELANAFLSQGLNGALEQGKSSLKKGAMELARKALSKSHADPEDREKNIQAYSNREYRKTKKVKLTSSRFEKAKSQSHTRQVLNAYQTMEEAMKAVSEERIDDAYKLGKTVLRTPAANSSRSRLLMYTIRKYQGKDATALRNLELIADWNKAPLIAYSNIINEYLESNQTKNARKYIEKGQKRFGNESFYPAQINLALRSGNLKAAQDAFAQCDATRNASVKEMCAQYIGSLKIEKPKSVTPGSLFKTMGKAFL